MSHYYMSRLYLLLGSILFAIGKDICGNLEFINKTKKFYDGTFSTVNDNRVTLLKHGDFMIQIITNYDCGYLLERHGMSISYIGRYALKKIENRFNRSFGLQIDTNCGRVSRTMSLAYETISNYQANSFCRKNYVNCAERMMTENNSLSNKRIFGVIGAETSFITYSLANLFAAHSIPLVSWLSTSQSLDQNKEEMRSFFRTIPPEQQNVEAIFQLLLRFNWTYISFIGSKDLYGQTAFQYLNDLVTGNSKICFSVVKFIDDIDHTKISDINDFLERLEKKPKTRVAVAFVREETQIQLIAKANTSIVWINFWQSFVHTLNEKEKQLISKSSGRVIVLSYSNGHLVQDMNDFVQERIKKEFQCDQWLRRYVHQNFGCNITDINGLSFYCQGNPSISIKKIVDSLEVGSGYQNLLIDAIYAMGYGIYQACNETTRACKPTDIVNRLKKVEFINANGVPFSFDNHGNPKSIFYRYNVVHHNRDTGMLEYKSIGNWTNSNNGTTDTPYIVWDDSTNNPIRSQCSLDCPQGFVKHYKNATESKCCWDCKKCRGVRNYSGDINQERCQQCPSGYHTENNIHCKITPVQWVDLSEIRGQLMFCFSTLCFLLELIVAVFFYKYRRLATMEDHSPVIFDFICIINIFNYIFAVYQIVEPTQDACVIRTSLFFLLLMAFSIFLLLLTQHIDKTVKEYADLFLNGKYRLAQIMLALFIMFVQINLLVFMFNEEGSQISQEEASRRNGFIIKRWCHVELTSIRLVLLCAPILQVVVASFFAFRERNGSQAFYERQLLTFGCLSVSLLLIAVGIGNVFVSSYHDYIMLCCGTQITGISFLVCFILPRIYVGMMKRKYGEHLYHLNVNENGKPRTDNKIALARHETKETKDNGTLNKKGSTQIFEGLSLPGFGRQDKIQSTSNKGGSKETPLSEGKMVQDVSGGTVNETLTIISDTNAVDEKGDSMNDVRMVNPEKQVISHLNSDYQHENHPIINKPKPKERIEISSYETLKDTEKDYNFCYVNYTDGIEANISEAEENLGIDKSFDIEKNQSTGAFVETQTIYDEKKTIYD